MNYQSEEEFLAAYDPSKFKLLSVTTDILILSISSEEVDNYRKTDRLHMSVLLVKRHDYPFKDKWCLPGGFVQYDEDLEDAPKRILREETNLQDIYLEQLYTFGDVNRDPRMRIISTSYMALIDKSKLNTSLSSDASWFDITWLEEGSKVTINFDNGSSSFAIKMRKDLKDHTTDRYQFYIEHNDDLAFDHPKVILAGLERLRNKVNYTDIVFNMMPEYFTLGELQQVYEVILNKKLLDPAFRRIIEPKVIKTDKMRTGGGHRPSVLFKYRNKD